MAVPGLGTEKDIMISSPPARSAAALGLAGALANVVAAEEHGPFTDPADGAFDASEWLIDRKGLLPVFYIQGGSAWR
jgi:hypothetical protein